MSQTLLHNWPVLVSAAIFLRLWHVQSQAKKMQQNICWYMLVGSGIVALFFSTRLFTILLNWEGLATTLATVQTPIVLAGCALTTFGFFRQRPLMAVSNVAYLLRHMLVELGEEAPPSSAPLSELGDRVQLAIQKHKQVLTELQHSRATNDALIAAMPDMLFQVSAHGVYQTNLTPQHNELYIRAEQFIGKHIVDILPHPINVQALECVRNAVKTGQIQHLQYQLPPNEQKQFEARFVPVSAESVLVIIRDATDELQQVDQLRHRKRRYQALLHQSHDAIVINSMHGNFTDVTQRAIELFGYSKEELLARSWPDLYPKDQLEERIDSARTILRERGYLSEEMVLHKKDGEAFFAHVSATLTEVDGIALIISIVRDISKQKQAQFVLEAANFELEQARNQLETRVEERTSDLQQANRDLETLLYVISHDLKEPLRAIENFSLLVNKRYAANLDAKGQDFLRRVVRASERMRNLINDILQLSRAHRMELHFEDVSSHTLVDKAVARLEARIEELDAKIVIAPDLPTLHVNVTWATEAIYNLISNALKYHRPNHPPEIEIHKYDGLEQPGLVIRDNGIGIQPEHSERIFQLFQRAVGREIEGTGAGLAIVREVAQRHHGNVWVQPNPDGGSEFYITLGHTFDLFEEVSA